MELQLAFALKLGEFDIVFSPFAIMLAIYWLKALILNAEFAVMLFKRFIFRAQLSTME